MPVTLLEFTAGTDKQTVITNWQTTQETNLKHFIVEHSVDGINFNSIGSVIAKGSEGTTNKYEFIHANPATGANYYRLKQVDNDEKFTYSPAIKINFSTGGKQPIAYPNPVKNNITLAIPNELFNQEKYQVMIMDVKNSLIRTQKVTEATSQIKLENLAAGTYWLVLMDQKGNRIWTHTMIKE